MHHYVNAMRQYAVFSGRATRSQYWLFSLILFGMLIVALMIDQVFGDTTTDEPAGVITGLVYLAHLVPSIAVGVRRLHDTDRSGWWLLAVFVPLIGQLAVLIFMCLPSSPGRNRFDVAPGYEPHEPFAGSKPATPASGHSLDQLEKIASLRASGAIDEDEFKQLKANVLSRSSR
ncbi:MULTISPECIES: DUF805 domain-containing protein [Ochrobactrum]|uniref:DUF805 domain-containing protein n=1 Tax=Ochrobactrum soli TaxID=2448455 RepID=A0A849KUQ4_9HYPH|nr:DUF805 domain-containing protein [[Ochrobactrum] soli]NNU63617.1 DUF805 domain-containing protein [[Ochrobactrum] soli]